jgi:hypothetical protein
MLGQTVVTTFKFRQLLPDWAGALLLAALAIVVITVIIRANRKQPAK